MGSGLVLEITGSASLSRRFAMAMGPLDCQLLSLVCRGGDGGQMGVGEAAAGDASLVGRNGRQAGSAGGNDGAAPF